jgi:TolB-like protein/tetratricopeptide (TPR) repeat protein
VSTLRKALGTAGEEYIETIPRRGYRFKAPVSVAREERPANEAPPSSGAAVNQAVARERRPAWRWLTTTVLVVLTGILVAWLASSGRAGATRIASLAVLPIQNLTGNQNLEFVADGTTEELISTLSQIPSFRVIARTSVMPYKISSKSAATIARELGVEAVLEGSVRETNGRLRVSARLVEASGNASLWSATHDGSVDDLLRIQEEVARSVLAFVDAGSASQGARVSRPRASNPRAHEEILKGHMFRWRNFDPDMRQAIAHYRRATEFDPNSAVAYSGLSISLNTLSGSSGIDESRTAAAKALALDPDSAEAHAAMATVHSRAHEWEDAYREYRRALALNPASIDGCFCFVVHLAWSGRANEALAVADDGVARNPRVAAAHQARGLALYYARRYQEAIPSFHRALELDPQDFGSKIGVAQSLGLAGRGTEAVAYLKANGMERTTFMVQALWRAGRHDDARRVIGELTSVTPPVESILMAAAWAAIGGKEEAISWFTRSVETLEVRAPFVVDIAFDGLRSDPQFESLVARLKMPPSYYQFLQATARNQ